MPLENGKLLGCNIGSIMAIQLLKRGLIHVISAVRLASALPHFEVSDEGVQQLLLSFDKTEEKVGSCDVEDVSVGEEAAPSGIANAIDVHSWIAIPLCVLLFAKRVDARRLKHEDVDGKALVYERFEESLNCSTRRSGRVAVSPHPTPALQRHGPCQVGASQLSTDDDGNAWELCCFCSCCGEKKK
jgi:hypothetical protein